MDAVVRQRRRAGRHDRDRRPYGPPCPSLFPLFSFSWPVHADAFRMNNLVWPRAVLPVGSVN